MSGPVVFIHGLWLHATSWAPWIELFRARGLRAARPGLARRRRHRRGGAGQPGGIADHGIDDVVDALRGDHRTTCPTQPILVGHSFGGMIAEKLLGQDLAPAAVAIDAAQIKGVLPLPLSALRADPAGVQEPGQQAPRGLADRRPVPLRVRQRRSREEESDELYEQWTIPAPGQAAVRGGRRQLLPALAGAGGHRATTTAGPLLLISGGKDHTVPEAVTRSRSSSTGTPRRSPTSSSSRTAATP